MEMSYSYLLIVLLYLLSTFLNIHASPLARKFKNPRKFIIDTDAGGDDAVAILLALNYQAIHKDEIEIIAITCTHGNTAEKNVEQNVLKILTVAKRDDIPVYGGAERALINDYKGIPIFGNDGFGDFEFKDEFVTEIDRSSLAAVALINLIKSYPGEVTVIALGPLTNLALATRLDSAFIENVGELIIMGSSVAGIGNEMPNVEFNFAIDPESNFIVMNSTTKPCTLFPWETTLHSTVGKKWRKEVFGQLNSPSVKFLNKVEAVFLERVKDWSSVDTITVAIAIWPNLIKKSIVTNVTPVFDGAAKGSVLVDYNNSTGKPKNTKIVQSYDVELFKKKLLFYFSN